jgi:hypothetical protein
VPRQLSNWLDAYIQYTQYQEAPEKIHTWIGLSVLASAVRRNVYLPRGYWNIFPNLYVAVVAPTGFSKTSAADIGVGLLDGVKDIDVMKEKLTSYFLLDYFDKLTKSKGECCVTLYAPEMRNFLGDLNKTELVTALTSYYGCPSATDYRTKGGGILKFKNLCINLLACSTPEWLTLGTTTDEIAGGFTGRFVYVFEDTTPRSFPFPEDFISQDLIDLRQLLIDDLNHIATLTGEFIITDQAKAEYIQWYTNRTKTPVDERLLGYHGRKRDLVFKLAMLLSLSQDDTLVIDEDILHNTFNLLARLELKMLNAFAGVVDDPTLKYKDMVVSQLARASGQTMSRAEMLRKNWTKLSPQVLDAIISNLVDARMVVVKEHVKGTKRDLIYTLIDMGVC